MDGAKRVSSAGGSALDVGAIAVMAVANSPRWSVAKARAVLSAAEWSGQSLSAFAREQGIDPLLPDRWTKPEKPAQ